MDLWNLPDEETFALYRTDLKSKKNKIIKTDNLHIFLCTKGTAKLNIDISEHIIIPNTIIILFRDAIINIAEISEDFEYNCVLVNSKIILEMTSRFDISFFIYIKENPCFTLNDDQKIGVELFYNSIEYINNDSGNIFRHQIAKNMIHNFLLDVYDKTNRIFFENKKNIGRTQELFRKFIFLILNNSKTERRVTFYADKLNITSRHLSTIVKNTVNKSPKDIINSHAILEIKFLLKSTNKSIQEISNEMLFPDQSFLGRFFKKYTGMSPIKFRNN